MGSADDKKLLVNAMITPDGTYLESRHRHDYKTYEDKVTGETYMIDGGTSYRRVSVNAVPPKNILVYSTDSHELIKDSFSWGTRGKLGDQPLKYVLLKDLTPDHIENIITTQRHVPKYIQDVFKDELYYRDHQYNLNVKG